jgi:hypothetical protein
MDRELTTYFVDGITSIPMIDRYRLFFEEAGIRAGLRYAVRRPCQWLLMETMPAMPIFSGSLMPWRR